MNLHYILLVAISLTMLVSQNAYATPIVEWQFFGFTIPPPPDNPIPIITGNLFDFAPPVTLHIEDESHALSGHIIATITSPNTGDSISIQLDESSPGIFDSGPIIFMDNQDTRIGIEDTPTTIVYDLFKKNGNPNEILDGDNYEGVEIISESDKTGILVDLVEDGDAGIFKGTFHFCTDDNCSNTSTDTLWVKPGDIISIKDWYGGGVTSWIITPSAPTRGAVNAAIIDSGTGEPITDTPQDLDFNDFIIASYDGVNSVLELSRDPNAPGRGGGGLIRPGLVIDAVLGLGSGSAGQKNPTLGLDAFEKRIVDGGFSFNGNPVDVNLFYTPYPLITTPVGQNNTIKLKIFENRGPDNIAHVGLSYGLGKGETFNEGRVTIEYDRTFDGIESVTVFDPKDVIGSVNVTTAEVSCSQNNNEICLEVTFDHMFRESLEYNMVATNIWDFQRNGWQNYFNHGIHIVGESMNPPEEYSGIHRGHIYHLTETGKNTAVDEEGHSWTFDKIWNRDYIKPVKEDVNILNPKKISAIEKLGYKYSDGQEIFGFDRMDYRFTDTRYHEQNKAQTIMASLCPVCQEEPFENIDEILTHDMPDRQSKLENNAIKMNLEEQRAQEFLKQYFVQMYPGKVDD